MFLLVIFYITNKIQIIIIMFKNDKKIETTYTDHRHKVVDLFLQKKTITPSEMETVVKIITDEDKWRWYNMNYHVSLFCNFIAKQINITKNLQPMLDGALSKIPGKIDTPYYYLNSSYVEGLITAGANPYTKIIEEYRTFGPSNFFSFYDVMDQKQNRFEQTHYSGNDSGNYKDILKIIAATKHKKPEKN